MPKRAQGSRVLIYSHDSFGLGHLRRCRAIAHALVDRDPSVSVLILSGSPIIGSFDFKSRVDFIRVPGVIKLSNGEYTSLNLNMATEETLALRASILEHTAAEFDPDLFLVDKEPLGLRGEIAGTLELLAARGASIVLGLRDVMDDPGLLAPEWARKAAIPALERFYDAIWVYGLPEICRPLDGIGAPASVLSKMIYTGYLRRERSRLANPAQPPFDEPYVLVTPGGGGDGEVVVDWVLRAYEAAGDLPWPALIVTGPFMQLDRQAEFAARAEAQARVEMLTFDAHLEDLMAGAAGVVGMGGYNTFCEILSFDKPAILVPRSKPRLEQTIRATRAAELGLVERLGDGNLDGRATDEMVAALRRLPGRPRPSEVRLDGLLGGLDRVAQLFAAVTASRPGGSVDPAQRVGHG